MKYLGLIILALVILLALMIIFRDDWFVVFSSAIACAVAYLSYKKHKPKD